MFVLPNLFTLSSVFFGFSAIIGASGNPTPTQLHQASMAVFFALFFDMTDGRVARLTRTQSEFGVQIDSLADVISFGVAPGFIMYQWAFSNHGLFGILISFTFVACGALRLARFNVLASHTKNPSKYFMGLPIPIAAGLMMALVMFHQDAYKAKVQNTTNAVAVVLVMSYLMISNVRYRTFKNVRPSLITILAGSVGVAVFALVAAYFKPRFALLVIFAGFIMLGPLEEIIFFRKRRREDKLPPVLGNNEPSH